MRIAHKNNAAQFKAICLVLAFALLFCNLNIVNGADVLPIISPDKDESNEMNNHNFHTTEGAIVNAIALTNIFAHKEASAESKILFNITGGTILQADLHSFGNEYIAIKYNDQVCYVYHENVKAIVGDLDALSEQINKIAEAHRYDAEAAVEIVPAPHHYSVAGKILYYNYQDYIWSLCVEFGIEEHFTMLLCQFYQESSYNQNLISPTNDHGLCQLNIRYHDLFKKMVGHPEWDVINDPYANMYCGVFLMAKYIKQRGNLYLAMTDYNAGCGYTDKYGVKHDYTDRVDNWYKTLKRID